MTMAAPEKPFRVGRSATGLGLFAAALIEKNTDIVEYTGPRIPTKEAQALDRRRANKYLFEIDRRWTIDGSPRGNVARYVNHACDPNVGWLDERTLATMTDVAAGEELVTDYAMSIVEPEWFLRCHCPSYRCRQMVEGTDWRIPQLQRRYAGWWAPHVQALVDAT